MDQKLQQRLMTTILDQFDKKSEAVEKLSDLLGIGKDAVYRRLRGDTVITPDEVAILAKTFRISLDTLVFDQAENVFFTFNAFTQSGRDFESFLSGFMQEMERAQLQSDYQFYYASVELPLFQAMFFPELIEFKMFIWGQTVLDYDFLQDTKFHFDLIPHPLRSLTKEMLRIYISLPSRELWSQNIIDNTLNQIEYYVSCDSFQNPSDALVLCDKLTELTHHMQQMAKYGRKAMLGTQPDEKSGATFDLYHNEMVHTNNTILATTAKGKVLYTTLSNPNFLRTNDPQLCSFMDKWFEQVIRKANAISNQSEKSRDWFFNRLRKKIELSKTRIKMEIGMGV